MATYLVTGGGGFIGSSIAEALLAKGERVRILDDFSTGRRSNVEGLKGNVELIEGSVVDGAQSPAARAPVRVFRRTPTHEELDLLAAGKPLPDPRLLLSEGVTDSDGRFALDDLPDGRWVVQFGPPLAWYGKRRERATSVQDVPVDDAPVTLRLESE